MTKRTEQVTGIYYTADNSGRYKTPTAARRAALAILAHDKHRFDITIERCIVTASGHYVDTKGVVSIPHWAGDPLGYYSPVNGDNRPATVEIEEGLFGIERMAE